jgi:hypothetical protein
MDHLIPHLIGLGHTAASARECLEMTATKRHQTPTVKIADATPAERAAINILTPQERKAALLQAARDKAASMVESTEEGTR